MLSRLSIRSILFVAVAALALLLIGLALQHSLSAYRQRTAVQAIEHGNITGDLLIAAAGGWAAERGRTTSLLNAPGAASASELVPVGQLRQQADAAFARALERLRLTGGGLPELERAEAALRELDPVRR